jgi:hypothetical protein
VPLHEQRRRFHGGDCCGSPTLADADGMLTGGKRGGEMEDCRGAGKADEKAEIWMEAAPAKGGGEIRQ